VFLFGHVPVPYSGDFAADFHVPAHQGAWPADVFYGDMNGTWTDYVVNDRGAESSRNWNVPGDGKFDQSYAPSAVELEVGRVDLSNLTAFSQGERELLRQYLNKDHNYRHRLITAQRRGLVHDDLGVRNGEAYAASAWRNFAPRQTSLLSPAHGPNRLGSWGSRLDALACRPSASRSAASPTG